VNLCTACRRDFSSVAAFDRHRTGKHAYDFVEGLRLGFEDGRRCLDADEMRVSGMALDQRGRWCITADVERAQKLRIPRQRPSETFGQAA
jgi:hypothetical protein